MSRIPVQQTTAARHGGAAPIKEPPMAQIGSFVDLFVWLLVLKSFFLPLFIIPTGSMAETLAGAHATNTCPNCGYAYSIGPVRRATSEPLPEEIQCPNCRLLQRTEGPGATAHIRRIAGDRIMVHGWPFAMHGAFGGWGAPARWDVVVFKNPNEPDVNFIKRLIGLPGEVVEIINGDVFITPPDGDSAAIARKTEHAQQSLWFPYYDHDYLPAEATAQKYRDAEGPRVYFPQWLPTDDAASAWNDLRTRRPMFDGLGVPRQELLFVNNGRGRLIPGDVIDQYGYNSPEVQPANRMNYVSDVRVGCDLRFLEGDGYFELSIERFDDLFRARLRADGTLTLEHAHRRGDLRPLADPIQVELAGRHRISLAHADGHVTVAFDGEPVLESGDRYTVTPEVARRQERTPGNPALRLAAEDVRLRLERVRIDRDVHYLRVPGGHGVSGNPLRIPGDAYFVLGDNSPASQDSRAWTAEMLGPHLLEPLRQGTYKLGTVPARDMIGKAFFVYWPGFMPLTPSGPNIVLDFGRVRWIH